MAIELSNLTFTEQDDIVPSSGVEQIRNTGVANTLAGNDKITGSWALDNNFDVEYGFFNSGIFNTAEGNDIIIGIANVNGIINTGTFNTGEGDDVITGESDSHAIIISSGSIFDTGDGNDRISGNSSNLEGRDFINGISNDSFNFNTGDGNDTIEGNAATLYGIFNQGYINTGNGKDIIIANIRNYDNGAALFNGVIMSSSLATISIIDTGEDDDIITVDGEIVNRGTIDTGNGDDLINAYTSGYPYGSGITNMNAIEAGEGNDTIEGNSEEYIGISNIGSINTGNGKDIIIGSGSSFGLANFSSTIDTGDDDDIIISTAVSFNENIISNSGAIYNDGTINTGNGQDSIISKGNFNNRGVVFLGEGNDSITASIIAEVGLPNRALENFNAIETGNGDDIITSTGVIYNEGVINTGSGNDYIEGVDIAGTGYGIYNNGGAINMGNGNDSIIANEGFESAPNSSGAWFLGDGEDYIKGFGSGDFYGGSGNDTLELTQELIPLEYGARGANRRFSPKVTNS
jgi:hypothetical protein